MAARAEAESEPAPARLPDPRVSILPTRMAALAPNNNSRARPADHKVAAFNVAHSIDVSISLDPSDAGSVRCVASQVSLARRRTYWSEQSKHGKGSRRWPREPRAVQRHGAS